MKPKLHILSKSLFVNFLRSVHGPSEQSQLSHDAINGHDTCKSVCFSCFTSMNKHETLNYIAASQPRVFYSDELFPTKLKTREVFQVTLFSEKEKK